MSLFKQILIVIMGSLILPTLFYEFNFYFTENFGSIVTILTTFMIVISPLYIMPWCFNKAGGEFKYRSYIAYVIWFVMLALTPLSLSRGINSPTEVLITKITHLPWYSPVYHLIEDSLILLYLAFSLSTAVYVSHQISSKITNSKRS